MDVIKLTAQTLTGLPIQTECRQFLGNCVNISFSRSTLLRDISYLNIIKITVITIIIMNTPSFTNRSMQLQQSSQRE
jgi:hypothetical protein